MVLSVQEKMSLVTRNLQEIVTTEELQKLVESKEQPVVYLGTAVTGRPHVGYFVWGVKAADFLKAGFKVKILLADVHGALDNCPWPLLEKRYEYYKIVISGMLKSAGADISNLEFIKGSEFQLGKEYLLDVLKLSTFTSVHDATKAASDVVKFGDNPKLSGLIYPLMQALDEQYLGVDIQFGGVDQRKIMMFARENLNRLGYKTRVELMFPLMPGLTPTGKMSSSDPNSKIDLIDSIDSIKTKFNKAFCPEKQSENNGVLAFCKYVIFPVITDKGKTFDVIRPEKFGGNISFKTYEELEKYYVEGKLHPMDLKTTVTKETDLLCEPIRKAFIGKEKLIAEAYPQK
ncbi:MAG TPA: tyrosine--tRNA ligase [archaeon]|nr:tyrosine--tRNA ligase [archaeon]